MTRFDSNTANSLVVHRDRVMQRPQGTIGTSLERPLASLGHALFAVAELYPESAVLYCIWMRLKADLVTDYVCAEGKPYEAIPHKLGHIYVVSMAR